MWLLDYFKMLVYLVISLLQLPNLVDNWTPSKEGFEPVTSLLKLVWELVGEQFQSSGWCLPVLPSFHACQFYHAFSSYCSLPHSAVITGDRKIAVAAALGCAVWWSNQNETRVWHLRETTSSSFRRKVFLQSISSKLNRQKRANEKKHRLFFLSAVNI